MKKIWFIFPIFIFLLSASVAQAFSARGGESVFFGEKEVEEGNFFAAGTSIEIAGEVEGDVFAFGKNILVSGVIGGDLIGAGNIINVSGEIKGNLRTAGFSTIVSGKIGKNISSAGETFILSGEGEVGGDLMAAGRDIKIYGPVLGEAVIRADKALLNSRIAETADIKVNNNDLKVMQNAEIGGDLNYQAWQEGEIAPQASIAGSVNFTSLKNIPEQASGRWSKPSFWGSKFYSLLSGFLVGSVLLYFMRKPFEKAVAQMRKNTWKNIGRGFLFLFLTPFVCFLLIITIIGLPLGLIGVFLYFLFLYLAKILGAAFLGEVIGDYFKFKKLNRYWRFGVGLLALTLISLVPILGFLFTFFLMLWAIGAGYKSDMEMIKKWK